MAEIHALCFPDAPWDASAFDALMQKDSVFWFASQDDSAFVFIDHAAGQADILTLAVHPDHRRRGQAATLLDAVFAQCEARSIQELFLEVGAANTAARTLYVRAGFEEVGRRQAYYAKANGAREDAIVLKRSFGPQSNPT